jgi:putative IMPACT (imprinted ancient) family translation regulator
VLAGLPVVEKVASVDLVACGPYAWVTPVARLLPDHEARIIDQTFAADVTWQIRVPVEHATGLAAALVDLSHGEIEVVT